MTETVTIDRPSVAKPKRAKVERRGKATVSASALALHLDCSRTYIGKLEAEGVIQRQGDGFPLDQSRVAYLRYLRRERKQSPRSEADAHFIRSKAELINLRIQERKRVLVSAEEAAFKLEKMLGVFLSGLSSFAARIAGKDLAQRRQIEKEVYNLRVEISETFDKLADEEEKNETADA